MRQKIIQLTALLVLTTGCTMIPEYNRPEAPVPDRLPAVDRTGKPEQAPVADTNWQSFIADPALQNVIKMALENNRDLRIATLNIEKAGALYRIQRSELYPTLTAGATASRERTGSRLSEDGEPTTRDEYAVGAGFTAWELDLFGRIRSLKEQALQQYLATETALDSVQLSLVAGVSNLYLATAADRESLQLAEATLNAQQETADLIRKSFDLGVASELELLQAQSQVEAAKVDVARYRGLVETDLHALHLLVGTTVPEEFLPESLDKVSGTAGIQAGISSDVLLKRPDVRMAEHHLKAMNANIGAARAAFFPRIALTAFAGSISTELDELFDSGTGGWSFSPRITLPIFDMGARRANLKAARVERDIAVANYEKTVQTAFKEVSDALSLRRHLENQLAAQQALTDTARKTYQLSKARYDQGVDSYLSVLIAQRSHYAARMGLVQVKLAEMANRIGLYKVLASGIK